MMIGITRCFSPILSRVLLVNLLLIFRRVDEMCIDRINRKPMGVFVPVSIVQLIFFFFLVEIGKQKEKLEALREADYHQPRGSL